MVLTRIFKIFSIAALFVLPFFTVRGEIALGSRCYLQRDYSDGQDGEFLYRTVRQIHQMARKSKIKTEPVRTEFRINAKKWLVAAENKATIVYIPHTSIQWNKSFAIRRIIYGIILRAQFNLYNPTQPEKDLIPLWMAVAVDEVITGRNRIGVLFMLNKNYSALQQIFKHSKALPDFGALCRFKTVPDDPASAAVYRQMARLLMELAVEQKLLKDMLQYYVSKHPDDYWLVNFATPKEAQVQLTDRAAKFLWGKRSSTPEPLNMEELKQLRLVVVPALDESGIPSGKMLELSFADANKLFLEVKRPDLDEVRKYYRNVWMQFGTLRSAEVRELAAKLSRIAGNIGDDEDVAAEFNAVFKQLEEQLKWEQLRFKQFIKLAFIHLPVDQLYSWQITAQQNANRAAGTGAAGEFLKRVEKEYFKNY